MPEIASLDSLTVDRDSSGKLAPETNEIDELGGDAVKARGLTKSEKRDYIGPMLEGEEVPPDVLAEWFDEKIVAPDLRKKVDEVNRAYADAGVDKQYGGVTPEFVEEELTEDAENGLFFAILLASGEDMERFVDFYRKLYSQDLSVEDLHEFGADPRDMDDEELRALGMVPDEARAQYTELLSEDDDEGN